MKERLEQEGLGRDHTSGCAPIGASLYVWVLLVDKLFTMRLQRVGIE